MTTPSATLRVTLTQTIATCDLCHRLAAPAALARNPQTQRLQCRDLAACQRQRERNRSRLWAAPVATTPGRVAGTWHARKQGAA